MSPLSKNYEKAVLGGAVVIAAGLLFLGWQKLGSSSEEFSAEPVGRGKNDPAVKEGDLVSTAKASYQLKRDWVKGDDEGRPVDLLTGVALFVNKNDPTKPVDLIEGDPVHPPIPNQWWIDNRIDPGFGNSPLRDEDEDGFSNSEEFIAKTDPKDARDYPGLITKLSYVGEESVGWVLRPGFEADGAFTFTYNDSKRGANKVGANAPIAPGGLFFAEGAAKGRFKLLGSEVRKEVNEAIKAPVDVTYVKIEDQRPNKKGDIYEIPAMFRTGNARMFTRYDRTAVLTLDALGMAGKEFRVEEKTAFSLPPGSDAKNFTISEITPEQITIEMTDKNGKKTFHIAKGAKGPSAD